MWWCNMLKFLRLDYHGLNHANALSAECCHGFSKIQRRHIPNKNPLDCVMYRTVCSCSSYPCTESHTKKNNSLMKYCKTLAYRERHTLIDGHASVPAVNNDWAETRRYLIQSFQNFTGSHGIFGNSMIRPIRILNVQNGQRLLILSLKHKHHTVLNLGCQTCMTALKR